MRPDLHLCEWWCRVRCALGAHERLTPESHCRCCRHLDRLTCQQVSQTDRSERLTTRWWQS